MNKILSLFFCMLSGVLSYAQTPDELNAQSKDLLTKKDYANAVPLLKKQRKLAMQKPSIIMVYATSRGSLYHRMKKQQMSGS